MLAEHSSLGEWPVDLRFVGFKWVLIMAYGM